MSDRRLRLPEETETLQDFFINSEEVSPPTIRRWLRSRGQSTEPSMVMTIMGIYEGYMNGTFRISGDDVALREWEQN